ncbi:MAG: class I SAM-dependent methyltransferase [Lachnospiraceae bacterium]|nr:class I SAM-dependent methyltransferase [Lachnospiraceae bacterium]MBQ9402618.1 class I SAM-dependent methyltransferase [Clostridia bacterium]
MDLKERIKHGWEISAEGYSKKVVPLDFVSPGREIWTDLILEKAPRNEKMQILDVGTGPGVFATLLSLAGHDVTGIDISPRMLEEARSNSAMYNTAPCYLLMDSEQLDFPDNSFDMIVSRNVVWIMQDPEAVYQKWLDILKPGGRIVVFDSGHGKDDFLTAFDHNNEEYIRDYKERFGKEPSISFDRGRYEEARGFKRDLKLTYEERPKWDVETLAKLGYRNIEWENVAFRAAYTEELKYSYKDRLFFRLCADKATNEGACAPGEK